jgi:hypothetical protein
MTVAETIKEAVGLGGDQPGPTPPQSSSSMALANGFQSGKQQERRCLPPNCH